MPHKKTINTYVPSILVVDDEEEILQILDISLTDRGFTVETAISASVAVKKISTKHFDLVISDINMPNMSGLELLGAVRRKGNKAPFILITGVPDLSILLSSIKEEVYDYLHKPFSLDDLVSKIDLLLDRENGSQADTRMPVASKFSIH